MKSSIAWFCIAAAGFIGIAAGYFGNIASQSEDRSSHALWAMTEASHVAGLSKSSEQAGNHSLEPSEFAEAFANAITQQSELHRIHDLRLLASKFELANLPQILEVLRRFESDDTMVLRIFLSEIAARDPRRAIEEAQKLPKELKRTEAMEAVLSVWAKKDEKAALAWIETLDPEHRQYSLLGLAVAESEDHFGNAVATLRAAMSLPWEGDSRTMGVDRVFEKWAVTDPVAAVREARTLGDGNCRSVALTGIFNSLDDADPRTVMECYRLLDSHDRESYAKKAAGMIASQDPKAAMDFISSIQDPGTRYSAIDSVADHLLDTNRDAAMSLVATVPPEESMSLLDFLDDLCQHDPKVGLAECARRMDAFDPDDPVRKRFSEWVSSDFVIGNSGEGNPQPYAEFLAADSDPERSQWLSGVMADWAQRNTADALQWVNAQTDPQVRSRAIAGLAAGWAGHDATETAQWIGTLPAGPLHDAAIDLIHTISNRNQQMALLQKDWDELHRVQPAEAERWLSNATSLSAAERAALQAMVKKTPAE